jgi:hypothetical protein
VWRRAAAFVPIGLVGSGADRTANAIVRTGQDSRFRLSASTGLFAARWHGASSDYAVTGLEAFDGGLVPLAFVAVTVQV